MRGELRNKDNALRDRDYSGLVYKRITPTDIDGFFGIWGMFEIHKRVFIFFELKHIREGELDTESFNGQRVALERLVDIIPVPTLLVYANHNCEPSETIDGANCIVDTHRYGCKWYTHYRGWTLKAVIDKFLRSHNLKDYVG